MEFFKKLFGKVDAKLAQKSKDDCGCQSGCCDDMPVKKATAKKKATKKKVAKKR